MVKVICSPLCAVVKTMQLKTLTIRNNSSFVSPFWIPLAEQFAVYLDRKHIQDISSLPSELMSLKHLIQHSILQFYASQKVEKSPWNSHKVYLLVVVPLLCPFLQNLHDCNVEYVHKRKRGLLNELRLVCRLLLLCPAVFGSATSSLFHNSSFLLRLWVKYSTTHQRLLTAITCFVAKCDIWLFLHFPTMWEKKTRSSDLHEI